MMRQMQSRMTSDVLTYRNEIPVIMPERKSSSAYSAYDIISESPSLTQLITDLIKEFFQNLQESSVPDWFPKIIRKILYLNSLQYDWDTYGAKPISLDVIAGSIRLLFGISKASTLEPYVFPTAGGGIQFEWHTQTVDLEIEVTDKASAIVIYEGPGQTSDDGDDWEQSIYAEDLSRLIQCVNNL